MFTVSAILRVDYFADTLEITTEDFYPSTATFLNYTKYEEYTWYSFEIGVWNITEE